jgi:hypothetical protein
LGSHLHSYTWSNVAQLEKDDREFLAELARQSSLLPGRLPWRSLPHLPTREPESLP